VRTTGKKKNKAKKTQKNNIEKTHITMVIQLKHLPTEK
jgi:hypothetical protein